MDRVKMKWIWNQMGEEKFIRKECNFHQIASKMFFTGPFIFIKRMSEHLKNLLL